MRHIARIAFLTLCLFPLSGVTAAEAPEVAPPAALKEFVAKPEPKYRWELKATEETPQGKIRQVHLVSQEWQGIVWEHALQVYEPTQLDHSNHVLLFVTGGRTGGQPRAEEVAIGLQLANWCHARVATIHHVPNQPLLGDHVEDDLITETWLKYLETGDDSWPLLFPMVKSAVKAMDAVTELVKQEDKQDVKGFVITGASKRGWTSWLTPAADKRVIATAPIVINTLNFPAQMKYQIDTWGEYSEQIADYTRKGLVRQPGEAQSQKEQMLWRMMDPIVYRAELELPKLMIVGTNDRYWVVDAMTMYWDDLIGPKYTLQVPNVGHNLGDGKMKAMQTLSVFFRHAATGKELPKLDWKKSGSSDGVSLSMTADPQPKAVVFWSAQSKSKDFRESKWSPETVQAKDGGYSAATKTASGEHSAVFGEFQYEFDGLPYSLTTQAYRN
jgi:PhoPQ-activated pathogenicity-related protein